MEKENSLEQDHEGRLPQTASHFPVPSRLSHPDLSDVEIGLEAMCGARGGVGVGVGGGGVGVGGVAWGAGGEGRCAGELLGS